MILRKLGNTFSEILPLWNGETVVLLGGGPSLTLEHVALVKAAHDEGRVRCIAVNDQYLVAPWADCCYAADSCWHVWNETGAYRGAEYNKPVLGLTGKQIKALWRSFQGEKCSIENSGGNITDPAVHILRNKTFPAHSDGLSTDPQALVTGRNGGFQALNLATLAGAQAVLLCGYDGQIGKDGRTHALGGHPRPTPEAAYPLYVEAMSKAKKEIEALGVTVINCSSGSAILAWEKVPLEEALIDYVY